jgi:hypothetical protein
MQACLVHAAHAHATIGWSVGWLRMCVRACVCAMCTTCTCASLCMRYGCAHAACLTRCRMTCVWHPQASTVTSLRATMATPTRSVRLATQRPAPMLVRVCACSCVCVCVFVRACVCVLMRSLCLVQHANTAWHACASCRAVTAAAPLMQRV